MPHEYQRSPTNQIYEVYKRPCRDKEIPYIFPSYKNREPMACQDCHQYLGVEPKGNLCPRCKSLAESDD